MTITLAAVEISFNPYFIGNVSNIQWLIFIILAMFIFTLLIIALYKIKPFNTKRDKILFGVI